MQLKSKIASVLFNPWLIGFVPAMVIILLLPELSSKYNLQQEQSYDNSKDRMLTFFEDIDYNGKKEKVDILNHRNMFASCFLYEENGSIERQFDFYGNIMSQANRTFPIFCDVTNDSIKDLFLFTQQNDSIFLNAVDLYSRKIILYGRFITRIGNGDGKIDFVFHPLTTHDYNQDGVPEIYFHINGGYSLFPRKIMAYDFANDTLLSSLNTGSQLRLQVVKKTKDELLIFGTNRITQNCSDSFPDPYIDSCAWLFGFNDRLELIFKPKAFEGRLTYVNGPIVDDDEIHFCVLREGFEKKKKNYFEKTDLNGNIIRKLEFSEEIVFEDLYTTKFDGEDHNLLNCTKDNLLKLYEYDPKRMQFDENRFTKKLHNLSYYPFTIDGNTPAFIGYDGKKDEYSLFVENLNNPIPFHTKLFVKYWDYYVQTQQIEDGIILMVASKETLFTFLITKNIYYPFRYLFYLIIYFINVGFIFIPIQYQKRLAKRRLKQQEEISALQMKLVNTGLEPHFTFNVLNTISSKILKGNRYEAYDLLNNFSDMMRATMQFSEKDSWTLKEELKFTTDYLSLMKGRFMTLFEYSIEIDEEVKPELIKIPLLLVQNFVDNAIKHAFIDIDYIGKIDVKVKAIESAIEIVITDNGIGREKSALKNDTSTKKSGKGILMNARQIEIFNKLYNTKILFEIEDNFYHTHTSGTRVRIQIPSNP